MTQRGIIVIGGGIAGTSAAAMLASGVRVVLIKADRFWIEKSPAHDGCSGDVLKERKGNVL